MTTADDVARQLSTDYPPDSLGWVKNAQWSGPAEIPLSNINFANRKKWNAWHEPARVTKFANRIAKRAEQGRRVKPVVLADLPDSGKNRDLMIVDGHHRSLAYQKLGKPVWGYVGRVPEVEGPWTELHAKQRAADTRATTDDDYGAKGWTQKTASWQAWEQDREHAQRLADNLQAALLGAVDTHQIANEWATIVNNGATGPGEVEGYLLAKLPQVRDAIGGVLGPAWMEAWELGTAAAQHQLQATKSNG
jgi:hypothetical protein